MRFEVPTFPRILVPVGSRTLPGDDDDDDEDDDDDDDDDDDGRSGGGDDCDVHAVFFFLCASSVCVCTPRGHTGNFSLLFTSPACLL